MRQERQMSGHSPMISLYLPLQLRLGSSQPALRQLEAIGLADAWI